MISCWFPQKHTFISCQFVRQAQLTRSGRSWIHHQFCWRSPVKAGNHSQPPQKKPSILRWGPSQRFIFLGPLGAHRWPRFSNEISDGFVNHGFLIDSCDSWLWGWFYFVSTALNYFVLSSKWLHSPHDVRQFQLLLDIVSNHFQRFWAGDHLWDMTLGIYSLDFQDWRLLQEKHASTQYIKLDFSFINQK